jgi:hypothetical protein
LSRAGGAEVWARPSVPAGPPAPAHRRHPPVCLPAAPPGPRDPQQAPFPTPLGGTVSAACRLPRRCSASALLLPRLPHSPGPDRRPPPCLGWGAMHTLPRWHRLIHVTGCADGGTAGVLHDPYERINFWSHAVPGTLLLALAAAAACGGLWQPGGLMFNRFPVLWVEQRGVSSAAQPAAAAGLLAKQAATLPPPAPPRPPSRRPRRRLPRRRRAGRLWLLRRAHPPVFRADSRVSRQPLAGGVGMGVGAEEGLACAQAGGVERGDVCMCVCVCQ